MPAPFFLARILARAGLLHWWPGMRRKLGGSAAYLRFCSDRTLVLPLDDLIRFDEARAGDEPDLIDLTLSAPQFERALSLHRSASQQRMPRLEGLLALREEIADRILSSDPGTAPADEITITQGGSGAFHRVAHAFVNPGDRVVLFDPCSPLFHLSLKQRRARIGWLPTEIDGGRIRFAPAGLRKSLAGAKLLVFANPGNPTGAVLADEDLEPLIWWCNKYDVLIYCDESFAGFGDALARSDLLARPPARARTLRAGSLGVYGGSAGARVGWLAGDRDLMRIIRCSAALDHPFVSAISQHWALAMLRAHAEFEPLRAAFASKRQYALERLQHAGFNPVPSAAGFFFWLPTTRFGMTGRQFAATLREQAQVAVTPGDLFGPSGENAVRLSIAVDDGRLRQGLGRLAAFVNAPSVQASPPVPAELAFGVF